MNTPSLRAVGNRVQKAYELLPGEPADSNEAYERFEDICIAVLDAEFSDFAPGELQEFLETKLYEFRLLHQLVPFPDPQEV